MKKNILLIVLFLSTFVQGWCQGEFYYVENLVSKQSIVRQHNGKKAIVYTTDYAEQGFCLMDFSTMTATYAKLPSRVVVNDFEILGDRVYFCGTYGVFPYLGHFNISGLFGGTDDFHLHHLDCSDPFYKITDPEKLDVYNSNGADHVVMVGGALHYDASGSNAISERFVMDVHHTLSNWIGGNAVFNEASADYFYDIVATDNYVITIEGKEPGGNAHYMRAFDKPTTTTVDIFSSATWHTCYHSQGDYFPSSNFLLTRMSGDQFATVCYSENQGQFGAAISVFQAPWTLLHRGIIDQGTSATTGCRLKEIVYNPVTNAISLLQDMAYPFSTANVSTICQIDAGNNASAHYNDSYVLHSLCNWTNDGSVMATGTNMIGWLSAFRHGTAENSCHFLAGLTPLPLRSKDGLSEAYWPTVAIIGRCVISSPTITTHTIINKCR